MLLGKKKIGLVVSLNNYSTYFNQTKLNEFLIFMYKLLFEKEHEKIFPI